jgi:hypothetical protein
MLYGSAIRLFSFVLKEVGSTVYAVCTVLSGSPINIKVYGFASNKLYCSHHGFVSEASQTNTTLRRRAECTKVTMFVVLNCTKVGENS